MVRSYAVLAFNGVEKEMTVKTNSKSKSHQVYKTSEGKQVPGVTTIIGILDKPAIHFWIARITKEGHDWTKFRDDKASIGSLAHAMILAHFKSEQVDTSDYTKNQIDTAENSFLKFLEWSKDKSFEPRNLEQSFVSEEYQFGGTPDYVGLINGISTILDFKTGGIYDEHYIQLAAYQVLVEESDGMPTIDYLRILNIGRDETESFVDKIMGNPNKYWQIFLHLLAIYNLRKEK